MKRGLNKKEISALKKCKTLHSLAKWENKYIVKNMDEFDMKKVRMYFVPLYEKLFNKVSTKKTKKKGGRRRTRKTKKKTN